MTAKQLVAYGHFVFWREVIPEEVEEATEGVPGLLYGKRPVVEKKAKEFGCPWFVPPQASARAVFSRVCKTVKAGLRGKKMDLRKVKAGQEEAEFTVMGPAKGGGLEPVGGLCWSAKTGLKVQLESGDPIRTQAEEIYAAGVEQLSRQEWAEALRITLNERWLAAPARSNGGIYWLATPKEVQEEMAAVNELLIEETPFELVVAPCMSAGVAASILEEAGRAAMSYLHRRPMSDEVKADYIRAELKRLERGRTAASSVDVSDIDVWIDKLRALLHKEPVPVEKLAVKEPSATVEAAGVVNLATGEPLVPPEPPAPEGLPEPPEPGLPPLPPPPEGEQAEVPDDGKDLIIGVGGLPLTVEPMDKLTGFERYRVLATGDAPLEPEDVEWGWQPRPDSDEYWCAREGVIYTTPLA